MAKVRETNPKGSSGKKLPPALTREARENQLICLAMDLVEQRLIDGTASSQETTHFLKLGTTMAQLEKVQKQREIEMLQAKTQALKSQERQEELFEKAIKAMQRYSGRMDESDDTDEEEDY